jgi:predicted RNase H-like HicB family nuclease
MLAINGGRTDNEARSPPEDQTMKLKVIVHEAEEGGYWAEVPAIPGCATQGETFEELLANLYEAVEGCLSVDVQTPDPARDGHVLEIAV